jgi:hypothetical protein
MVGNASIDYLDDLTSNPETSGKLLGNVAILWATTGANAGASTYLRTLFGATKAAQTAGAAGTTGAATSTTSQAANVARKVAGEVEDVVDNVPVPKNIDAPDVPNSALKELVDEAPKAEGTTLPVLNKTCFVADTPILTPDGYKPIQDFKAGDAILSRPEDKPYEPVRPSVVEELFELAAPILELRLGGQTIETTAEHPFYVAEKGWVRAEKLEAGDQLVGHDDQLTTIESVTTMERHETVYNVRVAYDHTYFVGDEDWGFSVWVHNAYSVRQLADGTFAIVDDVGDVVPGFSNLEADEAAFLVKKWNTAAKRVGPFALRELPTSIDGRLKGLVPDSVPSQWGKGQIEDAIDIVEESLRVRNAEALDFAANPHLSSKWQEISHAKRVLLEERFLRQLREALGRFQ